MCFQQGLSRKPSRGTYSLKDITEFHSVNSVGKILEDSRRLSTKADTEGLPCGASWPMGPTSLPSLRKSVPHHH